ncbi:MAG TPA: hybrid sensor histidine kinase/response regulator [Burkholderiales bacterium]|nr:hybrid sensor histidine kinase/response regulator [Burkholderiales bacterium]
MSNISTVSAGPQDGPALHERNVQIEAYAIDSLYRSLPTVITSLMLMPIVIGFVMWGRVSHILLLGWVAIVFLIAGIRLALYHFYSKRRPSPYEARRWAHRFVITSTASGIAWGMAGILFFVPDSAGSQVSLYVSIIGLAAGSLVILCYWLPAYYAYAIPSVAMSAVRLVYEGTIEYQGMAALLLMFLVIITLMARKQRKVVYDAISLRFENIDLIDQLREQKDIAERANIAKSKFLAAASHDLRQPLHALGLSIAALNEPRPRTDRGVLVQSINRSLHALEDLFNALLDISKLDAGVVKPDIRDVALTPLLDRLSAEYEPEARAKGLTWHYRASPVVVRTDIALLETVVRNLIGNAIRYTQQGSVRLVCVNADGYARIEVADTGVGIPSERHEEVFREFVQLHNPERDRTKGLGLGLAIVNRLTRLLDHPLEMRSSPGHGSVFTLDVSLGDVEAAEAVSDANIEVLLPEESSMRILVIEDEVDARRALVTLLEEWGYEVAAVSSEEEAAAVPGPAPDIIIADYRLREEHTGSEAIRRVQGVWGAAIPALIITGDTAPERLRQAQQSGFALLHKPVSPGKLRAFLRDVQRKRDAPSMAQAGILVLSQ